MTLLFCTLLQINETQPVSKVGPIILSSSSTTALLRLIDFPFCHLLHLSHSLKPFYFIRSLRFSHQRVCNILFVSLLILTIFGMSRVAWKMCDLFCCLSVSRIPETLTDLVSFAIPPPILPCFSFLIIVPFLLVHEYSFMRLQSQSEFYEGRVRLKKSICFMTISL